MIGIELELNSIRSIDLANIFNNINLNNYNFKITEDEVFNNVNLLENIDFKKLVYSKSYINFLNVQVYFQRIKKFPIINSYNTFLESSCKLILLIIDGKELEIYFKDEKLKEQIMLNLKNKKYKYNIKTIESDGRTRMSVYYSFRSKF